MPHERLERFGVGRDGFRVYDRDEDTDIGQLRRGAAIASDDSGDRRALFARVQQGADQIRADVFFDVTAADGKDEDHVVAAEPARAEPIPVGGVPALVIDARGEFGNVVSDGVGFDACDLAEIARGMRGMSGASPDSQKKEAAAALTHRVQEICGAFDLVHIDLRCDLDRLAEILMRVGRSRRIEKTGIDPRRSSKCAPVA